MRAVVKGGAADGDGQGVCWLVFYRFRVEGSDGAIIDLLVARRESVFSEV